MAIYRVAGFVNNILYISP